MTPQNMIKRLWLNPALGIEKQTRSTSGLLIEHYQAKVTQNLIHYDPAQAKALDHLQSVLDQISYPQSKKPLFTKTRAPACKSLYIFGDVGRGKSMLMDLFYEHCPIKQKRRVHFHTFINEVHEFSHQWRQEKKTDVITALANKINTTTQLLCFDEFHIIDVANAVILDRLFSQLYDLGTVIVSTSNRHPDDLYQGGITPELFLSFIKLLKGKSDIIELTAKEDYRLQHQASQQPCYFTPADSNTFALLEQCYREITHEPPSSPQTITHLGREIPLFSAHKKVAFSTFKDLCEQPLGPADYLKLATTFDTLILSGIPALGHERHDEAKRFSTLIDALYFHKVKLICSAEVPALELYDHKINAFFLKRTVSRLMEMQSKQYVTDAENRK